MKNFVEKGETMLFLASVAIASGQTVIVGDLVGVAAGAYASGETGVLNLCGVVALPKGAGILAQGSKVYVAASGGNVSNTATDSKLVGYVHLAALTGDTTVNVLLARG